MENSTENNQTNSRLSSKVLDEHLAKLLTVLDDFLFEEKKSIYLKNGIIQPAKNTNLELNSIMQITHELKELYKEDEQNLDRYVASFESKIKRYSKLYGSLMEYPLHIIGEQLRLNLEEFKIAPHLVLELVLNLKDMLMSVILHHIISYDQIVFDELCEREIAKINVKYFVTNTSLRVLKPEKYLNYLQIVQQGISAFYQDFQSYAILDSHCYALVNSFFDFVVNKIELACDECKQCFAKSSEFGAQKLKTYPVHIFSNVEAFKMFNEIDSRATKPEEIGFLFRYMSEQEKPAKIISTETVFRKWYNDSDETKFNLKNPIKTYDRIGAKEIKVFKYMSLKNEVLVNV